MARTIATIQQSIIAQVQATPALAALTVDPSNRAIWQLWTFITATSQATAEQLMDAYTAMLEAMIAVVPYGSPQWVQAKVLQFQYSSTDPQVAQFDTSTYTIAFPVVNSNYLIISRCSVIQGGLIPDTVLGQVGILVATGNPPNELSQGAPGTQLPALQSYLNLIAPPGISYLAISNPADLLFIQAQVYYEGQYSGVIQANMDTAINAFLAAIPFDGVLLLSNLEGAMKAVAGVNDVVFQNVSARPYNIAFGSGTSLVQNYTVVQRNWQTQAGYIIAENATDETLDSPNIITYTPQ
jgi:hypothetical protein